MDRFTVRESGMPAWRDGIPTLEEALAEVARAREAGLRRAVAIQEMEPLTADELAEARELAQEELELAGDESLRIARQGF